MAFPFCLAKDKAGRFCVAFDPLDGAETFAQERKKTPNPPRQLCRRNSSLCSVLENLPSFR
jgi:hypothetical protein